MDPVTLIGFVISMVALLVFMVGEGAGVSAVVPFPSREER